MWKSAALFVTLAIAMPVATDSEAQTVERAAEVALIAGFVKGGAQELAFLAAVRIKTRKLVSRRWPAAWPQVDDLVQSAYLALCRMRVKEEDILPPLIELLSQILNREAKEMLAHRRRQAALPVDQSSGFVSPDAALDLGRLTALLERLPAEQASVLAHRAAEVRGIGPPLHEALEVTPLHARQRLAYARQLLAELANPPPPAEVARA